MTGMIVANEVIYSNDEKFILEDTAIGFSTHRLVNAIKFTIDGGNGPLEEKSLIKKVDCHGR
jgi:hypothetical protein